MNKGNAIRLIGTCILALWISGLLAGNRDPGWPALRRAHLAKHPACAVCGATSDREVHHIKPYTLFPDLEMDPKNLVTLCRSKNWGFNCHLAVGHGGNYSLYNPYLLDHIAAIRKIRAKYKTFSDECQEEIEDYLTVIRKRVIKYNSRPYEEMKRDPVRDDDTDEDYSITVQ